MVQTKNIFHDFIQKLTSRVTSRTNVFHVMSDNLTTSGNPQKTKPQNSAIIKVNVHNLVFMVTFAFTLSPNKTVGTHTQSAQFYAQLQIRIQAISKFEKPVKLLYCRNSSLIPSLALEVLTCR